MRKHRMTSLERKIFEGLKLGNYEAERKAELDEAVNKAKAQALTEVVENINGILATIDNLEQQINESLARLSSLKSSLDSYRQESEAATTVE